VGDPGALPVVDSPSACSYFWVSRRSCLHCSPGWSQIAEDDITTKRPPRKALDHDEWEGAR
jgi:hypothetical protein